jgi:hypothetical protein
MSRIAARLLGSAAVLATLSAPAAAQGDPPSPAQVLGYELGEQFTPYAGVQQYARALDAASDRVEYRAYGRTNEGRELFQLVVSSPENLRRLDQVLAANAELARPGTSAERAQQIASTNPAVVYFSYGVHGNESSSSEAAMWVAWDLARNAAEVRDVLQSLVVVIDPVTNPDGRDRYVQWFRSVRGDRPDADPQAREHDEPWPGGRFNHYLFDLNRDWSWATQVETRSRLATWFRWNPQVHVDFHEMGYNSSYFFFPAAAPINPIYPEHILRWGRRFGEANAHAFDAQGWPYYTAEAFDLFYPGYGDSWPSLTGAVGMTYEQAGHGAAGQAVRQESGDTLTLHDRAMHHRTSSQATLRAAASGREQLLRDYAAGQRGAGAGEADFLLAPGSDPSRVEALVAHLRRQGIEVERAGAAFSARTTAYPGFDARSQFPAGTYRVRARQPLGRLAVTLLQPETQLRAEFSYDVSAWSLPYAYAVAAYRTSEGAGGTWTPVTLAVDDALRGDAARASGTVAPASYGYLVAPGEAATVGILRLLRDHGRVRALAKPSSFGGRRYPAGTWFIPTRGNDSLAARLGRAGLAGLATPISSGLSEGGIDLGSDNVATVRLPRVALAAGEGFSPTSVGAHWFYLEREVGMPIDVINSGELGSLDLSQYDVIVLPEASGRPIRAAEEALKTWMQRGGRLVAVGDAAEVVAGFVDVKLREESKDTANARSRYLAGREERERQEWRQEVPGTILSLKLDPLHPLAFGAGLDGHPGDAFALHQGTRVFEPAEGVETVAFFPPNVSRISGVISAENLRRLGQGSWLVTKRMGQGSVVLFADDPLFRLFWRSTQPLYLNAILLGP